METNNNLGQSNNDQVFHISKISTKTEAPKMIEFISNHSGGFIKTQKQAEYVLLGFIVLTIGISIFLFFDEKNLNDKNLELNKLYPPGSGNQNSNE